MPSTRNPHHEFAIDRHGLSIDSMVIWDSMPADRFRSLLGPPDQILAVGPPAPTGHRNNLIHYYHQLGVTLNEHHYTHQIHDITFVFAVEDAIHATHLPYIWELPLFGIAISNGDLENVLSKCSVNFQQSLAGIWFADIGNPSNDDNLSVTAKFTGKKRTGTNRSRRRQLVAISVGLGHDQWDSTHRPNND